MEIIVTLLSYSAEEKIKIKFEIHYNGLIKIKNSNNFFCYKGLEIEIDEDIII